MSDMRMEMVFHPPNDDEAMDLLRATRYRHAIENIWERMRSRFKHEEKELHGSEVLEIFRQIWFEETEGML